jgi:predicted TIM-barrel enzyme
MGESPGPVSRMDFLNNLEATLASGHPILGAGAGTGLVARAAAIGGADFIAVYCTSRARSRGLPTSIIGDPNTITLELVAEVAAVVTDVPIVAGVHATDPTRRPERLLEQLRALGCSGVINYPSVGLYGREYIGGPVMYDEGLEIEATVLELAQNAGLLAATYTYRPNEARRFASCVDLLIAHAGWTIGGFVGAPRAPSHEEAAELLTEQISAAKEVNPEVICLGHGGPFSAATDTASLYALTDAVGFVGASSIERIPVERAVADTVTAFKQVALPRKADRVEVGQ